MVSLIAWARLVKWLESEALLFDHKWEVFLIVFTVIILVLLLLLYLADKYYEGNALIMKSEPHTMRNMFEELRIKTKRLNKKAKAMKADPTLMDEVIDQVDKLYAQINRDSDFLAYIAETNELELDVVPITQELEFVRRLIDRYGMEGSRYKIEDKLRGSIKIPSMITQSMVENAYKYGDKTSPAFMTVTFEGPGKDKKYTIQVKNKVPDTFDREIYSTKRGVKNLVKRIANYNSLNEDNYVATPKRACKNGYYIFKIDFLPNI